MRDSLYLYPQKHLYTDKKQYKPQLADWTTRLISISLSTLGFTDAQGQVVNERTREKIEGVRKKVKEKRNKDSRKYRIKFIE